MNSAEDEARAVTNESRRVRLLVRRDVALAVLTPVVLVAAWQAAAAFGLIDVRLFPSPSQIAVTAGDLVSSGQLSADTFSTLRRLLLGYISGAISGIAAGLVMGSVRAVHAALSPTFSALYALPKVALLPLLLLVFGLGETPKVLSVAVTIFFVLQINTAGGVRQLDLRVLEAARAYGATGWKRFRHVVLPACIPAIFTGLRVAAGLGVVVIVAVEFVASNDGLGFMIWNSWTLFQPERMYVGLVVVSLLGAVLTGVIALAERLATPWRRAGGVRRPVFPTPTEGRV